MSDKEDSPPRSRSRSRGSDRESQGHSKSRSRSRSRSYVSRSPSRGHRSRSRSASYGRRKYYKSRSRSRSPRYSKRRPRNSRSRSRSPRGYRGRSRSPMSSRRRHRGTRENPGSSRCVGVFGLSLHTEERDIREVFSRYGSIEEIQMVYDHNTGRSRGFAFIYYRNVDDAVEAKERGPGIEIDGHKIRVDFSITERAHTPTPGIYLGKPSGRGYGSGGRREGGGGSSRRDSYYSSSRRSPSPQHYSSRRPRYSRSRSRSYSPRLKKELLANLEE